MSSYTSSALAVLLLLELVACRASSRRSGNETNVDPDLWEKIVINLIGNAFKYTLEGSIKVSLKIFGDHVQFSVEDTGVGISPSDIDKVFDRFHRVDSVSRSHEGTGIGLALTKELVILHGGRISLTSLTVEDSPTAHGSTFTVSLPLGSEHLPKRHIDTSPMERNDSKYGKGVVEEVDQWQIRQSDGSAGSALGSEADTSSSENASGSRSLDSSTLFFLKTDRILIVDDSADMRRYVKSFFVHYCQVTEAVNGEHALSLVDVCKPDLIISDLNMPCLDGYGLIAKLRQRPETRLIPIILLTAKSSEEARVDGLLSGADDYMSKPFNAKELIARAHLQIQLGKKRAELETLFLARTREIQLLADLSPVGIFRTTKDGRIVYANQRWREITGVVGADELINSWLDSVHPDDMETVREAWAAAASDGTMASIEFRFRNGLYVQWQCAPLESAEVELVNTFTDVSAQRKLELARLAHAEEREHMAQERIAEAEARKEEADERRRNQELLIDVTSHELRQPVSAILNCASVIRANMATLYEDLKKSSEQNSPYLPSSAVVDTMKEDLLAVDAISQCGLAQERIANDVLTLSRVQLGALSIINIEFDVVEETKRVASAFHVEATMKRINIHFDIGESFRQLGIKHISADRARYRQILTNLLSNALKFTDMSTGVRDITVKLNVSWNEPKEGAAYETPDSPERSLNMLVSAPPASVFIFCSVRDSGPGITPTDLALLFQKFQQGSNSERVFGGSGLGLFVSRKLCDLMGGRIDVESTVEKGATFRFYVKSAVVSQRYNESRDMLSSTQLSTEARSGSAGLRVMIVEDNVINQTILNRQLKSLGCSTVLASNGLQAIEHLRVRAEASSGRRPFDVILMDCEMPVMDGFTATRKIRHMEAVGELLHRNLIFALTGNAREAQIQNARDVGMDEVMIKPYRLDELMRKVLEMTTENDS